MKSLDSGKILQSKYFNTGNTVLNTILFADDQGIFSESEDGLQRVGNKLENIANSFNIRISTMKTKIMVFQGKTT
jgi:hypothetical protein